MAKAVSLQGIVEVQMAGETDWKPVRLNDIFCLKDTIRVQDQGRAAFLLRNESILRLDQKTTITFNGIEKERTFLLNIFNGSSHFFSRFPKSLKVYTPFVNAVVEGTEFLVKVERDHTFISIFEGRVAATNESGSISIARGQTVIAERDKPFKVRLLVRPRDAVQWALYYPPIIDFQPKDFPGGTERDWQGMVRRSIGFYWDGNFSGAFSSIERVPEDIKDPRFFTYRASLNLSVGRIDEARTDIQRALSLDPKNSHAFALRSIIAVVQNNKERALNLAKRAVELDPKSPSARVALSYAEQAVFNLEGALKSIQEAVKLGPKNALAKARLAELWLSFGYLDRALKEAKEASALNPRLARTQSVLGFAYLTQIKTKDSKSAFEKAIRLDQAAPLPRLGFGLAKIRGGDLKGGRAEVEIAASLDPNNSLIRSYMGKAYFDEKRSRHARSQFEIAKELDPLDPTPYFYDAIEKQTTNRPVEALHDLQKSIELNNNRAIYRSKLLLDEDLAARSASLGRIYTDLGFDQLALVEGWKSVNTDPSNFSAHRFLADLYSFERRHEIARVSELLQSQLLQPININPIQPQLAESDLLILEGSGPGEPAFNEFNPLFNRNRLALLASAVAGRDSTFGAEPVVSGVYNKASFSTGWFHYETDGFRDNNDLKKDILDGFVQISLTHKTSIQFEYRYKEEVKGDLTLRFDPNNFRRNQRKELRQDSIRFGFHHVFDPQNDLIGSFFFTNFQSDTFSRPLYEDLTTRIDYDILNEEHDTYLTELRHLFRSDPFYITVGGGYYNVDTRQVETQTTSFPSFPLLDPTVEVTTTDEEIEHINAYVYSSLYYPKNFTWTIGGSADIFRGKPRSRDQINPKFGVIWNPFPSTTLRAALSRVFKRRLPVNQTIEPTQVAGFNQFFDDTNGSDVWRYGFAIDQKFLKSLNGGLEVSWRDLEVPFTDSGNTKTTDWNESNTKAFLYWTPHKWFALRGEYLFERFERKPEQTSEEEFTNVDTHFISFGSNFFHPSGLTGKLKVTYVDQEGTFEDVDINLFEDSDKSWIIDGSISYRLPKRYGLLTIGARNLFGEPIQFQETDLAHPRIYPDQMVFAKITLSF